MSDTPDTLDISAQGGQHAALLSQLSHRLRRLEMKGTNIVNTTQAVVATLGMNGNVLFGAAVTTITVMLPANQLDTLYQPQLTPERAGGTPAAGSYRPHVENKTLISFDIVLEAAPGGGASVRVNWIITRPFTR